MGRKAKILFEIKVDTVLRCLSGKITAGYEANELGVTRGTVSDWINRYQSMGDTGLITSSKNTQYSSDTKKMP